MWPGAADPAKVEAVAIDPKGAGTLRDFHYPGRSTVHATRAMAATSHPAATLTAIETLRSGGNAVDAAVAACAVLCVIEPAMTGLGGDCFCLFAPAGGDRVIALNGSGHAPAAAEAGWFREHGIAELDPCSAHAVTVPGAVDAWSTLVRDHGRKSLDELLRPAIAFAEEGFVAHARVAADWAAEESKLLHDETARERFRPNGRPVAEGDIFRQPELAGTLRKIAAEGRDGFYTGSVAEDIVACLRAKGGLHTLDDFAAQQAEYVEPVSTDYRGYRVHECPPNGVGIITLLILNMLEALEPPRDPLSADRMHLFLEAVKLAFRDRNAFVADPRMSDVPVDLLLSKDYARELAALIDPKRAATNLPPAGIPRHEDTTYLCVVDEDGNAISFINSIFQAFGSGILAPKSGVLLQNRGFGFVLDERHPNCIAGRKRPMHTIIPAMVTKDGAAVMPFGVMGGHYQPAGQSWVLSSMLDCELDVQAALDLPRLFAFDGKVDLERGVPEAAAAVLRERGHDVRRIEKPHGGGQAIWIDRERGTLSGGSDPRKDGCALGY